MVSGVSNIPLRVADDVAAALEARRPVVALESTIISHGMPYPRNVETALRVEAEVRAHGAVPATIAMLDGAFQIGLTSDQIDRFGAASNIMKASRRDVPVVTARKLNAATTVATTMMGAAAAGIALFATGGTGGVHRGAELTFDVSADLWEFTRTPVAVVSAGVKAILDIPKTLEYLETLGVPVLGFGTDEFPAFYSRTSGIAVPVRVDDAQTAAAIVTAARGQGSGVLIANPIPEAAEIRREQIEPVILDAVAEAERRGVAGKDLTPFLLARIVERTGGRSLEANIALVLNNARLAARVAVAETALKVVE